MAKRVSEGNIVAIVGRPNVGKSTLFNRLTGTRGAIVHETSGVTRDRHYGKSVWNGVDFSVIDTGGYVEGRGDVFEEEIRKQVRLAIEEADAILFLVDVTEGLHPLDQTVASLLRKSNKDIFLVVNKVDNTTRHWDADIFYTLGLGQVYKVSSINGSGTGDLLDDVVNLFKKGSAEEVPDLPRFAVVGRPNVGKSTLINSFLGEERHIVTPVPGTTRDSIYTEYNKYNFHFYLVDTAGIRKKSKVSEDIEFYSVMRSIRAIEHADICLLMIDAMQGMESQDMAILNIIIRNNKGLLILVNKWDLVEKNVNTARDFEKTIKNRTAPFRDVPVLFVSAVQKQRIHKILEKSMEVYHNRKQKIATSLLNEIMLEAVKAYPPPAVKGKQVRIKYVTQLPTHAPAFAFFCNYPQSVKEPYKRYLENKIRDHFNFTGVPIQIFMRKK
ncbi:MAG: ribosome biogenesis GTPase Der [Bacteroidales bacterium]|nr:ribosome biogenesis GTPase Der [Bacteroidales bacterium]